MDKAVSAVEANRHFSKILRSVREGESYVVTAHGKPIARIVPAVPDEGRAEAKRRLLDRLAAQPVMDIGPWTRDELYDE
jgi:prevent-host-death family protein